MTRGTKRILILVTASVVSIAAILYFTVDERTGDALADIRPMYLVALFGCWMALLLFDAGAIVLYTRGTDERIKYFPALKTTTVRIFFNIITPFAFGGQPFSVVSLRQEGIPAGKGSSIVIVKLMTLAVFTQVGALLSFVLFNDRISNIYALNKVFMISGIVGGGAILLLTLSFLYPQILVKTITTLGKLLHLVHIVKDLRKLRQWAIHQAVAARRSFKRYFSHHILYFIGGTLCNGMVYAIQVSMLWLILLGLGINVTFLTGIVLASMLLFLITFMPTPGAIGLGEAIFLLLFSKTVPSYMLGIAIVLWRFFFHYLSAILGAITSSKYMSDLIVGKAPPQSVEQTS
jgi:glycosyltransferase 2 family protein